MKGVQFGKEEIKLPFSVEDMTVYVENAKALTKKIPGTNKQLQQDCRV